MDTELARTFLAVVGAGNFVRAAERLFVTQSAAARRAAPRFHLPAYLLYPAERASGVFDPALDVMRALAISR